MILIVTNSDNHNNDAMQADLAICQQPGASLSLSLYIYIYISYLDVY